jgi:hypothetical protein
MLHHVSVSTGTIAVSREPLTKVVGSGLPLRFTTDQETNLLPETVMDEGSALMLRAFGVTELIRGAAVPPVHSPIPPQFVKRNAPAIDRTSNAKIVRGRRGRNMREPRTPSLKQLR